MISSQKTPILKGMLQRLLTLQLKHRFHSVHVHGLEHLQSLDPERPSIAFSNHCNWWDAYTIMLLSAQAKKKDFYCMADETYLSQFVYLKLLGAFPVDIENPVKAAASIRYATRLLTLNQNLLWIFPQGTLRSEYDKMEVETSTHSLATKANSAQMLPVAFQYEFFGEKKPRVFIKISEPFPSIDSTPENIRFSVQRNIDFLKDRCVKRNLHEFEQILSQDLPFQKQFEAVLDFVKKIVDSRSSKKILHRA